MNFLARYNVVGLRNTLTTKGVHYCKSKPTRDTKRLNVITLNIFRAPGFSACALCFIFFLGFLMKT